MRTAIQARIDIALIELNAAIETSVTVYTLAGIALSEVGIGDALCFE
jgi:hypothetical protein